MPPIYRVCLAALNILILHAMYSEVFTIIIVVYDTGYVLRRYRVQLDDGMHNFL